jgi:glutathione S-transferase
MTDATPPRKSSAREVAAAGPAGDALSMGIPVLYGATYSVYTRIARLALLEKGIGHGFEEVDIFRQGGPPAGYLDRHPFARIPAFSHDEFALYETAAITRYVDEGFAGPPLQPNDAQGRARVAQIVGILDSYGYRAMVWDVFVERVRRPASDEARIAAGLAMAERCLGVLEGFLGDGVWLAGENLTLADLHAAPMLAYFREAPEGAAALERHSRLAAWWERIERRASMQTTVPPQRPTA